MFLRLEDGHVRTEDHILGTNKRWEGQRIGFAGISARISGSQLFVDASSRVICGNKAARTSLRKRRI